MPSDFPEGGHTLDDLARLEAEGVIKIIKPGTPEAEAFEREMAAELAYADAELLASEGPDALTSDRLLRQAALSLGTNPEYLAYAFMAWCSARGWEWTDLASWLGVTVDQLAAMALVPACQGHLAERYGADPARLAAVLDA